MNLIYQLLQLALALAQTQLNGSDSAQAYVDIVRTGLQVYETQTGKPMDPALVGLLKPL